MSKIETGGPAFPCEVAPDSIHENAHQCSHHTMLQYGMNLRQYAAIKLRVPNSGTDWLDEMIRESLRDRMAEKAMQALLSDGNIDGPASLFSAAAYHQADSMLKEREAA